MDRAKGNIISCQNVLRFIIAKHFDDWKAGWACPSFDRRTKMHPDSASLRPNHRKVRHLPRGKPGNRGDSVSECGRISENPCTITMQSQLDHSARHFCASRIAAAMRTSPVSIVLRGIAKFRRIYPAALPTNIASPPSSRTPALFAKKSGRSVSPGRHRPMSTHAR